MKSYINPRPAELFGHTRTAPAGGGGIFFPLTSEPLQVVEIRKKWHSKALNKVVEYTIVLKYLIGQINVRSKIQKSTFYLVGYETQLTDSQGVVHSECKTAPGREIQVSIAYHA